MVHYRIVSDKPTAERWNPPHKGCNANHSANLGPVVQSIVSLASVFMTTYVVAEVIFKYIDNCAAKIWEMQKLLTFFQQKNINVFAIFQDRNLNVTLANKFV